MSSINNNSNNGKAVSPETLAQSQLQYRAQKNASKAIHDAEKTSQQSNLELLELLGMTPTGAKHAIMGKSTKPNKFTIAGAASSLSPPAVPKYTPTDEKTQQRFLSLHRDINQALDNTKVGLEKVDLKNLLSPTIKSTSTEAETKAQAAAVGTQAQKTVEQISSQVNQLSSSSMTLAFLMLRVQGQSDGLDVNNQMSDLSSSLRKVALNEQIAQSKAAEKALQKAMKKQEALKPLAPILAVITAVLSLVFAVATMGTGIGLALTITAAILGFAIGGTVGGKKKDKAFDITSALEGLSIGASVVPTAQLIKPALIGAMKAIERAAASAGFIPKFQQVAANSVQKGIQASQQNAQNVSKALQNSNAARGVSTDFQQVAGADTKIQLEKFAQEATEKLPQHVNQEITTYVEQFLRTMSDKSKALIKASGLKLPNSSASKASFLENWFTNVKTRYVVEGAMMLVPSFLEVGKAAGNFAVSQKNLEAQEHLNEAKLWGVIAKTEQGSWQGSQDVLSMLQDYHNQGVTQAMTILQSHHQASLRAIQYING